MTEIFRYFNIAPQGLMLVNKEYKFSCNIKCPSRIQWSADNGELYNALPAAEVLREEGTVDYMIELMTQTASRTHSALTGSQ
jgi:hypothetical protein